MSELRLLTLNLHCLVESDLPAKQQRIATTIQSMDIDVVFLQEVAQTETEAVVEGLIKEDNYALTLKRLLGEAGAIYHLYYVPIKRAFNRYDEGVAILSKHQLSVRSVTHLSKTTDYGNWKSRKLLCCDGVIHGVALAFATTHFGWSDGYEVFEDQVDLAIRALPVHRLSILAGDFNVTPDSPQFRYVLSYGLHDIFADDPDYTYLPTHKNNMDIHDKGSRIDYIMTNQPVELMDRAILFEEDPVSDHYGVYALINLK